MEPLPLLGSVRWLDVDIIVHSILNTIIQTKYFECCECFILYFFVVVLSS